MFRSTVHKIHCIDMAKRNIRCGESFHSTVYYLMLAGCTKQAATEATLIAVSTDLKLFEKIMQGAI